MEYVESHEVDDQVTEIEGAILNSKGDQLVIGEVILVGCRCQKADGSMPLDSFFKRPRTFVAFP